MSFLNKFYKNCNYKNINIFFCHYNKKNKKFYQFSISKRNINKMIRENIIILY